MQNFSNSTVLFCKTGFENGRQTGGLGCSSAGAIGWLLGLFGRLDDGLDNLSAWAGGLGCSSAGAIGWLFGLFGRLEDGLDSLSGRAGGRQFGQFECLGRRLAVFGAVCLVNF